MLPSTLYSKTCRKRPLKKENQKLVFKTDYRLMQVKSIAECSNFFKNPHVTNVTSSYILFLKIFLVCLSFFLTLFISFYSPSFSSSFCNFII